VVSVIRRKQIFMETIIIFNTELNPLIFYLQSPTFNSAECTTTIETNFNRFEIASNIQLFGVETTSSSISFTRTLGKNEIRFKSDKIISSICIWFECIPKFQSVPEKLCLTSETFYITRKSLGKSIYLGTMYLQQQKLLISTNDNSSRTLSNAQDTIGKHQHPLFNICYILVLFFLIFFLVLYRIRSKRFKITTRNEQTDKWDILGTTPVKQQDGSWKQVTCSPYPQY
jgi:hypothetical protein